MFAIWMCKPCDADCRAQAGLQFRFSSETFRYPHPMIRICIASTMYNPNEKIELINVAEEVSRSFLDYSMSVIISRALPDARDGLKPSQRRILYAMHDLSLFPNRQHRKCAKICGDTSGNYHPHGEAVIYPTLVHMAQAWAMRETLVDGQGNFGSVEGDPPAAMRYTEARMTHLGAALMTDMDKDTVDFVPNYDETRTEPSVFPAAFPNLLVNGGTGIAVGMATNMPPHNLGEVIDGICAQIDDPDITLDGADEARERPGFSRPAARSSAWRASSSISRPAAAA